MVVLSQGNNLFLEIDIFLIFHDFIFQFPFCGEDPRYADMHLVQTICSVFLCCNKMFKIELKIENCDYIPLSFKGLCSNSVIDRAADCVCAPALYADEVPGEFARSHCVLPMFTLFILSNLCSLEMGTLVAPRNQTTG